MSRPQLVLKHDDKHEGDFGSDAPGSPNPETANKKPGGRRPLARHLTRERIVHDLAESEKHCAGCGQDL